MDVGVGRKRELRTGAIFLAIALPRTGPHDHLLVIRCVFEFSADGSCFQVGRVASSSVAISHEVPVACFVEGIAATGINIVGTHVAAHALTLFDEKCQQRDSSDKYSNQSSVHRVLSVV